jgi:hypothetical protein
MATRSTTEVRNNSQGWGVAALVTLLALVCALTAWYIHNETYRSPRDPMFRQRGNATPTGGTTEHGSAARAGEGHAPAAQPTPGH